MSRVDTRKLGYMWEGWLFVVGDSERFDVYRNTVLDEDDWRLTPARAFIKRHGLIWADEYFIEDSPRYVGGQVLHTTYLPLTTVQTGTAPPPHRSPDELFTNHDEIQAMRYITALVSNSKVRERCHLLLPPTTKAPPGFVTRTVKYDN